MGTVKRRHATVVTFPGNHSAGRQNSIESNNGLKNVEIDASKVRSFDQRHPLGRNPTSVWADGEQNTHRGTKDLMDSEKRGETGLEDKK